MHPRRAPRIPTATAVPPSVSWPSWPAGPWKRSPPVSPPVNPPAASPSEQQAADWPSGPRASTAAVAAVESAVSSAGGWRENAAAPWSLLLLLHLGYGNVIIAGASVVYSNM